MTTSDVASRRKTCRMRRYAVLFLIVAASLVKPDAAHADLTAFLGANTSPSNRPVQGFAAGLSLLILGVEFEYANTSSDNMAAAPGLKTGMLNLLLQTPFGISGLQFYGTIGAGLYREAGNGSQETNGGTNVGGGVKVALTGPLRMRLDYRAFTLRGLPQHSHQHRFYAGLNIGF